MVEPVVSVSKFPILRRFARRQEGSVAIMFAFTLIPMVGMAGAAMDYTAASTTRAQMAQAADAAALAAAKSTGLSKTDRDKLARSVFDSSMGKLTPGNLSFVVKDIASGVRIDASGDVATDFMAVIGIKTMPVNVYSEVTRGEGYVEVALVLDNTYSMVNDMDGLKTAASNFVNTMFGSGAASGSLKMGIVPYVAAVNPGRTNLGMSAVDTLAQSQHHGAVMKWKPVAYMTNCDPLWGSGGGGGGNDPGTGGNGAWLPDMLNKLANTGRELFGVKPANALNETPNTKAPLSGTWYTPPSKNRKSKTTKGFVPTGFSVPWNPCQLVSGDKINHLDLFDRIPGAQWKGCVEARPEPYDVGEEAPSPSNANTLFVPYFWPDEPGSKGGASDYANNYMDDNPVPDGWDALSQWNWEGVWTILKYNSLNVPSAMTDDLGPNRGCPDALQRLTSTKTDLQNKISAMKPYKGGGGTINSEGVAWGWRVLSPNAPFADGSAYGKSKKFIVLMSDGKNEIGENVKYGPVVSLYSAYGYLSEGRFGKVNFQEAEKYMDGRFKKVCANAKAAGVTVMAVLFRESDANAKSLMQNCASSGNFFYQAADTASLNSAFQAIANEIGKIRITK